MAGAVSLLLAPPIQAASAGAELTDTVNWVRLRGCESPLSRPALREKFVALVDSSNSCDGASLVIKDFVRNMGRNAQPSHPGNAGPT